MSIYPDFIDPKIWQYTCSAMVIDREMGLVKVRYECATEFHFLLGKTVWLRGDYQVGDIVSVTFFPKKDRFGQTNHVPMLEVEAAEYSGRIADEQAEYQRV